MVGECIVFSREFRQNTTRFFNHSTGRAVVLFCSWFGCLLGHANNLPYHSLCTRQIYRICIGIEPPPRPKDQEHLESTPRPVPAPKAPPGRFMVMRGESGESGKGRVMVGQSAKGMWEGRVNESGKGMRCENGKGKGDSKGKHY